MLELLSRVDPALLRREVSKVPLAQATDVETTLRDEVRQADFLLAYYGYDLLSRESIRHALLTLFPLDTLNNMAKMLGVPESRYNYDAALIVSGAPWSSDSRLPQLLKNMLHEHFGLKLPEEYLPGRKAERSPPVEELLSDAAPPLLDYQREVGERVLELILSENARGMIQMPTGSGKTRTVMDAITRYLGTLNGKGLVLWLAHSEELCEQAVTTFKRCWIGSGSGSVRLYRLWGDHSPSYEQVTNGLVVGGLQKLVSLRKKKSPIYQRLASSCRAIFFDEAHKALAPTYRELLGDLRKWSPRVSLIGLTATPGRSAEDWLQNKELARLFNNQLITPDFGSKDPLTALREMGVLARLKRIRIDSPGQVSVLEQEKRFLEEFFDFPQSLLDRLSKDVQRNLLIVSTIVEQIKNGRPTIVFACSVEHSKLIAALVTLKGASACAITYDMTPASRGRYIDGFRVGRYGAIINYGILSTGFDAPNVSAVIITRPTASIVLYSQMIGRGMRGPKVGGQEECLVIDIVDNIEGFGEEQQIYEFFSSYWAADK